MKLVSVYRERSAIMVLYELLKQRTPEQSISHRKMPTMDEHAAFVRSQPYLAWYLIEDNGAVLSVTEGYEAHVYVGSVYLTKQREIGIFIFKAHHGKGYAKQAIAMLREKWPGRILANVNPANEPSKRLFERMGGRVIQQTYELLDNAP